MLAAVDVLKLVAERGPVSLGELEAAISEPTDGSEDGFLVALDAAVDHGFLRCTGNKNGLAGGYRLTRRGRRALEVSHEAIPAA